MSSLSHSMEPSSAESSQLSVANDAKTSSNGILETHTSLSIDGIDTKPLSIKLRSSSSSSSSSSSPDSPLDYPFGVESDDEINKSAQTATSFQEHDNDAKVGNHNFEKPVSVSLPPKSELATSQLPISVPATEVASPHPTSMLNNLSMTESPPNQLMERPANSKYRIPSHVFARNKSNTPVEWSVASNESLFSIHMGNTSFTGDKSFWRSGDLGAPGDVTLPGQRFNYSSIQSPLSKAAEGDSHELATPQTSIEMMKEDSRDSEDQNREKFIAEGCMSRYSEESGHSTKSFQFPILTDVDKNSSINSMGSTKLGAAAQQNKSETLASPKSPEVQQPKSDASPTPQPQAGMSWFSCFACCSFCR